MQFFTFRLHHIFIVNAVAYLNAFTFVYILFNGNFSVKHSPMIRFEIIEEPNGTNCDCIQLLNSVEVPINQSIFFIESNEWAGTPKLTIRQTCSVESAARINPDRLVFVLFLRSQHVCVECPEAMRALLRYPNVRFRRIELYTYAYNTSLEDFIFSGAMDQSKKKIENHSDMLRLLTLWKFGGIYMDLDVITLKSPPLINFVTADYTGKCLSNCVMGVQSRDMAQEAIRMFVDSWYGNVWFKNGLLLFTDLMKKHCKTEDVRDMYSADCDNITVLPPEAFNPIARHKWETLFNSSQIEFIKNKLKNAIGVQLWYRKSKEKLIHKGELVPYTYIASENCPKVFDTVDEYF